MNTTTRRMVRADRDEPDDTPQHLTARHHATQRGPSLLMHHPDLHPYAALTYLACARTFTVVDLDLAVRYTPWLTRGQVKWALGALVDAGLMERALERRQVVFHVLTDDPVDYYGEFA